MSIPASGESKVKVEEKEGEVGQETKEKANPFIEVRWTSARAGKGGVFARRMGVLCWEIDPRIS
jgi:hypothetical protein